MILDLIAHRSAFAYAKALRPNGTYFCVGGSVATLLQVLLLGPVIKRVTGKSLRLLMVPQNRKDLLSITELCMSGKIAPAIDKQYSFNEIPEAMRYVGEGKAKGKVVVVMDQGFRTGVKSS